MNIAMVTPWPPQKTGIADYAYDMACGLVAEGCKVTIITEATNPKPAMGVVIKSPLSIRKNEFDGFTKIVYHIGNNREFHLFQFLFLFEYPGVVHLHDLVLHHIMAWILFENGSVPLYRRAVARWYGPSISKKAVELIDKNQSLWDSLSVIDVPFFEEVVQHATKCIVHSKFSQRKIQAAFPRLKCDIIPQVYSIKRVEKKVRRNKVSLGVFGGVDPNKRVDIIIEAIAKCAHLHNQLELNIVGSVHADCAYLKDMVQEQALGDVVRFHGRVSEERLVCMLNATDLCISLRYPTMGETSAIVMRALQGAVPVVVSDLGWYAELPDFVIKIVPGTQTEVDELASAISKCVESPEYLAKMTSEVKDYAESSLNFDSVTREYLDILREVTP